MLNEIKTYLISEEPKELKLILNSLVIAKSKKKWTIKAAENVMHKRIHRRNDDGNRKEYPMMTAHKKI